MISMPITWLEKQYGKASPTTTTPAQSAMERRVITAALALFDELDSTTNQDDCFSVWSFAADKEFLELMRYCRGLRLSVIERDGS